MRSQGLRCKAASDAELQDAVSHLMISGTLLRILIVKPTHAK